MLDSGKSDRTKAEELLIVDFIKVHKECIYLILKTIVYLESVKSYLSAISRKSKITNSCFKADQIHNIQSCNFC